MSLRINQNVMSIRTHGTLASTSARLDRSIARLSSGLRINSAADDAAGLAISEKMRRQVRGLSRAILNAQDGISMIQAAEGSLNETHSILQRMRELGVQSLNDTLTSGDRLEIQKEVNQLRDDINRISNNAEFNTKKLLDGSQSMHFSASSNAVAGLVTGGGSSGGDYEVSLTTIQGGISQMQRSQIFTIRGTNQLATGGTQLQSIAQFYDSNGVFVLDTPLELNVSGNSETASMVLDRQMTLDKLAGGIQNMVVSRSGLGIENSRVGTVTTAGSSLPGLGGYVEVVSGAIGDLGRMAFGGDQKLMNALGFTVTREGSNSLVEVTIRDSFGNTRQTRTDDARAVGLLTGVDIAFASQAAQIAGTKGVEAGLRLTSANTLTVEVGGIANSSLDLMLKAGSWTMEGMVRSLNDQIEAAIGGQPIISGVEQASTDTRVLGGWGNVTNLTGLQYAVNVDGTLFVATGQASIEQTLSVLAGVIDAGALTAIYDSTEQEIRITNGAGTANITFFIRQPVNLAGTATTISNWQAGNTLLTAGITISINTVEGGVSSTHTYSITEADIVGGDAVATADNVAKKIVGVLIGKGIDAAYSSATQTLSLSAVGVTFASPTWVADDSQGVKYSLGRPDAEGLSAAVVDGQIRLSYAKPATAGAGVSSDIAITQATTTATTIGFINGTYSGFVDGAKDETKIQWGFTRYATAAGTAMIDIGDGQFTRTVTAFRTITDSLRADMQDFISFQDRVNKELKNNAAGEVKVRVDQVGGTIAFTSLRVGTEDLAVGKQDSMVTIGYTSTDPNQSEWAWRMFELRDAASKGSGDKNFRIHVVDNTPQFQIGADQGQNVKVGFGDMSARALGVDNLDMTSVAATERAMSKINRALDSVSAERSKMGSFQNRLEFAISNLRNTHSNLTAAESRIRDADIAMEMIEFTRNQIISQSGTAMLAQANLVPQGVLQLLR